MMSDCKRQTHGKFHDMGSSDDELERLVAGERERREFQSSSMTTEGNLQKGRGVHTI